MCEILYTCACGILVCSARLILVQEISICIMYEIHYTCGILVCSALLIWFKKSLCIMFEIHYTCGILVCSAQLILVQAISMYYE